MAKKDETIEAEVIEEGAVILSPFKDLDLSGGVDLVELMKTYAEVPEIDPEAENAGEQYQYVLKGHKAFVTARNKIEKVRKILVAPALAFNKDVNQRAKDLAYSISAKESELFKQRKLVEDNEQRKQDEAEAIERKRVDAITDLITRQQMCPLDNVGKEAYILKDLLSTLIKPTEETHEEFYDRGLQVYNTTKTQLESMYRTQCIVEEADKRESEEKEKRAKEDAVAKAKAEAEAEAFAKEREDFEREKAEFAEAKALREAEANAEAEEKAEIDKEKAEEKAKAEEQKAFDEAHQKYKKEAKETTDNEVYQAYADGGVDAILDKIYENEFTFIRWGSKV